MKGYPKLILKKQDFMNLLAIEEHKAQALSDLQKLYANDDTLILTTTSLVDPGDPMSDWNQEMRPNPAPLWQQKGFESREDLAQIITENGGTV
jgi:hypothetical protein